MTKTLIWKKDQYTNPNIFYLFNREIIEYDMKRAGLNLAKHFNLLPAKTIDDLFELPKDVADIKLGIIQKNDKDFAEKLKLAFQSIRATFFEINDIEESDVIAIKKDAIFLLKRCKYEKIGEYIHFRIKNEYTSYIHLERIELYYNPTNLHVKGINDNLLPLHENYILSFLKKFFFKMETDEPSTTIQFMRRFIDRYKSHELESGFYREFNSKSMYKTVHGDRVSDWDDDNSFLDISYNFYNVLIKLIKIPL